MGFKRKVCCTGAIFVTQQLVYSPSRKRNVFVAGVDSYSTKNLTESIIVYWLTAPARSFDRAVDIKIGRYYKLNSTVRGKGVCNVI
jgi:hypothetical protein